MARTFPCPHCGEEVKEGRLACPECGSDLETGWKSAEEVDYQSVEIPDYYGEEGPGAGRTPRWIAVVAVIVVLAFVLWLIAR